MIYVRTRVYVAAPISLGNPVANCQRAIAVGFELMDAGYAPFVPHYSYFVDMDSTSGAGRYEQWIDLDLSYISVCHALLRLGGVSKGADREVAWAEKLGIPVFYSVRDLLDGMTRTSPLTLVWPGERARGEAAVRAIPDNPFNPYKPPIPVTKALDQLTEKSRQRHG